MEGVQLGARGRARLPFLKIKEIVVIFEKGHNCVHLWVKFIIQNVFF